MYTGTHTSIHMHVIHNFEKILRIIFSVLWIRRLFIYFFNRSLLEYNCFTILCQFLLYNKVHQPYAYIYPRIPSLLGLPPTLPIPPLEVITKHGADLPVLRCCFPPAILHSVVYICRCYSHFGPASPSYPMSSHPFSMSTSLFLPCNQFISTIFFLFFFQFPYICVSIWYLFFSF